MSDNQNKKPLKKHDRHKRGLKLFFLPKAHGQKHKHKKNKYYVSHHDHDWSPTGSIMSGDSPTHHNRTADVFDYNPAPEGRPQLLESKALPPIDGRSSPVPTTSKDVGVQSSRAEDKATEKQGKGEVQASVLVEPGGGKDKEDEDKEHFGSPTLNDENGGEHKDEERRGKDKDGGGYEGRDKKDRKDDKFRKNGNIDKLDGVWVPKDKKPQEEDDDNCIVKCLYVTMTCCECSIM